MKHYKVTIQFNSDAPPVTIQNRMSELVQDAYLVVPEGERDSMEATIESKAVVFETTVYHLNRETGNFVIP